MTGSRQFLCMPPEIFCDGNLKEKAVTKLAEPILSTYSPQSSQGAQSEFFKITIRGIKKEI